MKKNVLKVFAFLVRLSLAVLLGGSLLSGLVPSILVASSFGIETARSCCIGKSAGHCKLSLKAKQPTPTEPMCGLKQVADSNGVTVIAEESNDASGPRVAMPSVGKQCANDCSACTARSSQQLKQSKRISVTQSSPSRATSLSNFIADQSVSISLAELKRSSPRGPPTSRS